MCFGAPCSDNLYCITVTSYIHKEPAGVLCHPWAGEAAPFDGLLELLTLLETRMDTCGSPRRNQELRYSPSAGSVRPFQPAAASYYLPRLATFRLQMLFRQNASWQGVVTWEEKQKTVPFRSELELLSLMDGALTDNMRKAHVKCGCAAD